MATNTAVYGLYRDRSGVKHAVESMKQVGGVGVAAGSVAGALLSMRLPEYEAKHFEGRIKQSGSLPKLPPPDPDPVEPGPSPVPVREPERLDPDVIDPPPQPLPA